jgi:hypothetical protein
MVIFKGENDDQVDKRLRESRKGSPTFISRARSVFVSKITCTLQIGKRK